MVVFHMNVNVYESEQLQPSNVASPLYIPCHGDYKLYRYDDSKVQGMGTVAQLNASPPDQVRPDVAALINKIVTAPYYNAQSLCLVVRLLYMEICPAAKNRLQTLQVEVGLGHVLRALVFNYLPCCRRA